MAEYYTIIKRAVAASDGKSGEGRRVVYDKARNALIRQLRSLDPPLSEAEITRQRLALEDAVRRVEAEAAENLVRDAATALGRASDGQDGQGGKAAGQEPQRDAAPRSADAPQAEQPGRQAEPPRPQPAPPVSPMPSRPETSVPKPPAETGAPVPPPSRMQPARTPPVNAPAANMAGQQGKALPEARPSQDAKPDDKSASRGAQAGRSLAAGMSAAGAASAASADKTESGQGETMTPDPQAERARGEVPASVKPAAGARKPGRKPAAAGRAPARTGAEMPSRYGLAIAGIVALIAFSGAGLAYWQRDALFNMLEPSSTPPAEMAEAPDGDAPAPAEEEPKLDDRIVPGDTAEAPAETAPPATPAEPTPEDDVATAAPDEMPEQEAAAQDGVPVAQRVMLYEETIGPDSEGEQFVGNVSWRVEEETEAGDDEGAMVIRGFVDVPDRGLKMLVTVRRNADDSLPASHTIELLFEVPPDFEEGGVANVPGILMKTSEPARGAPLVGASARVTNGYFLIGLSSTEADQQRNVELLRERPWMDIPVLYNNGRRAIMTLEKGRPGEQAFSEAFSSWES